MVAGLGELVRHLVAQVAEDLAEAVVGRVVAELLIRGPVAARIPYGVTGCLPRACLHGPGLLAQLALDVGHAGRDGRFVARRWGGAGTHLARAHLLVRLLDLLELARRLGRAAVAIRVV